MSSDSDLPYNLNFIGLFLVQFSSVVVAIFGFKAVASGKYDAVDSGPCHAIAIVSSLSWVFAVYFFIINNRTRNATGENKIVRAGLALTLFFPLWVGLLVSNAMLTHDISSKGCYGGQFCKLVKLTRGSGWLLFTTITLLLPLWVRAARSSGSFIALDEERFVEGPDPSNF